MKLIEKKDATSKIIQVFILDSSKSDGSGLTGLVYNSLGLTAYYIREGAASPTVISLVTATVGTWTSGGFKKVDATNMPGVYELHLPNACFASGAEQVVVLLKGASNMAPSPIEIQLRDNIEKDIFDQIGTPVAASISADIAAAQTDLDNPNQYKADVSNLDAAVSTRAPSNEYDTEMGYIPSNLGDVPTAAELIAAHGSGAWTAADISALATASALSTHDGKLDTVKSKTDTINWDNITSLIDEIGGKWEITGDQMIFYKSDNITEIMRFNLFDSDGSPAMKNVYKRERV